MANESNDEKSVSKPGLLKPPYPVDHCANTDCETPLIDETTPCFLFKDFRSGSLVAFCEDCAAYVELNHRTTFALVAL